MSIVLIYSLIGGEKMYIWGGINLRVIINLISLGFKFSY